MSHLDSGAIYLGKGGPQKEALSLRKGNMEISEYEISMAVNYVADIQKLYKVFKLIFFQIENLINK